MTMHARPAADGVIAPPSFPGLGNIPDHGGWRTPMQSPDWLRACYETLYPSTAPRLIKVGGGLAPLARCGTVLPRLQLAGSEELAEAIEPLVEDADAADRLTTAILNEKTPVRFGHVPADGPFAQAFVAKASKDGIVLHGPVEGSPVLELDASWADPLARFSSRRRSDFRRMQRRAEALGALAIDILAPTPEDTGALLDQAFAVEAQGWKARNRTAILQNPQQAAFLRRYGQLSAAAGRLRIAFLRIDGEVAAMQIMVEQDQALWLLKIGFDERFAKASPGMLLLLDTIRDAAVRGLDRVEFLGKEAAWTEFWTKDVRPQIRLRYYPRTPRGLATLAGDALVVSTRRQWAKWQQRKSGQNA